MSDPEHGPRRRAIDELLDQEADLYLQRTPASRALLARNWRRLPLGVASSFQSHYPYPLTITDGAGAEAHDLDGNAYVDLHGGFGANLLGHAHPAIVAAQEQQVRRGTHFAHPGPLLADYADELCRRLSMDQVRLCASGSEATGDAIRLARAFTGRDRIVKIEGTYHGHHDNVLVSVKPDVENAGPAGWPRPVPASEGVPAAVSDLVTVVAFNDPDQAHRALSERPCACVIVEPVMCNLSLTQPQPGYLQALRDLCDRHGTLLVFDQVKTALTIDPRGAVGLYRVPPDLQCLGKAIGGGVPVGAVGGRADVMALIADHRAPHYGTFSGSALAAATGLAALRELDSAAYAWIDEVGGRIVDACALSASSRGLPMHTGRLCAKGGLFFSPKPTVDYRDWQASTDHLLAQLHWLYMANRGVLLAPGSDEQWTIPVTLTDDHADRLVDLCDAFCDLAAGLPAI